MEHIAKNQVLFPLSDLQPGRDEIVLEGTPCAHQTFDDVSLLFQTSATKILEAIWVKYINECGSPQAKAQFQELYQKTCLAAFGQSIVLTGDMMVYGSNRAAVNAVNALAAVGFQYGFLFPQELEDGYRVNHSKVPCEALEFQVDREVDRWDTIKILSTDPGRIEIWQLFHSVMDFLVTVLNVNHGTH